jgi:transcriptional regulator with XRE-family HTH domain
VVDGGDHRRAAKPCLPKTHTEPEKYILAVPAVNLAQVGDRRTSLLLLPVERAGAACSSQLNAFAAVGSGIFAPVAEKSASDKSASELARAPERRSAIGSRLRANRTMRHLTLRELARRVGVSPSLISQIETGRSQPSVGTLYAIATELEVSVDDLLFDGDDARPERRPGAQSARDDSGVGPVQRAHNRRAILLDSGVRWERLTTQHDDEVEFLDVVYDVGGTSTSAESLTRHAGHEYGLVLSGRLGVTLLFEEHLLEAGDSISFASTTPHRLANAGDVPAHAIWCVVGRDPSPKG